jgi:hypothetical protein
MKQCSEHFAGRPVIIDQLPPCQYAHMKSWSAFYAGATLYRMVVAATQRQIAGRMARRQCHPGQVVRANHRYKKF